MSSTRDAWGGGSWRAAAGLAAALTFAPAAAASVPQDLRREILESQRRLEQIRAERAHLSEEIEGVRVRVRDISSELSNVERRLSATRSVLAEVEFQSDATSTRVEETARDLLRTRERMSEGKAVLSRRLRDIYKMGPLHTVRVLLGASSFTDLLNRYRYLQRIATFDRALVDRVVDLERALTVQDDELRQRMTQLGSLRETRMGEVARLATVEAERQTALEEFRSRERSTQTRLEEIEADEGRMTGLIADLERRRIEETRRASAPGAANTITAGDAGSLDWPIDGRLIYRFGRENRPNGLVLRWNGIGIAADAGTPVRAVRSGRVVLAGPFEGYGPTVVVSHGDGFYTLYLYLEDIGVVEGRDVQAGQVVGTVGGTDTPEGPHLEFQIRAPVSGSQPEAQDPLRWLSPRGTP